jgi:N-dimethylarginine dimethylaminohydrolase
VARTDERTFGGQTQVAPLRRVLLRSPRSVDLGRWRAFGWLAEPDAALAARQHDRLCDLLREAGAEVLLATSDAAVDDPDAVYVCDPAIVSDAGALVLRPGKAGRRVESRAIAEDLRAVGVRIAFEMAEPATAEGGDTMWLDERTLLVGRSYRTNDVGIRALDEALPGVDVLSFDLPNRRGPDACLHLLSLLSPLDRDLVVAYRPQLPVRLLELLHERGVRVVDVPDEEFASMGPNVLSLAPRVALAVDGNPETRRRMERAGVEVLVYEGSEISHKGEGGPTCLTRSLLRS